jgi:hypothetical protein
MDFSAAAPRAAKNGVSVMHSEVASRGKGESNTGAYGFLRTRPFEISRENTKLRHFL